MSQEPTDINRYLYEQIYSELKEEILSGKYHKGDWFPPERVLKDRFNTTHLTVRNALAKLVLEGYIERYSGKGTLVIYSRDTTSAAKRSLRFPYAQVILSGLDEGNARILESRITPLCADTGEHLLRGQLHRKPAEPADVSVVVEGQLPGSEV